MSKIRVLIVDDSALIRQLLREILSRDPEIEVVGAAPDAIRAWACIQQIRPDVLTLDVEMPHMDGLVFLEKLMCAHPMPVVMVSSTTEAGCKTTLRALELGAIDFVSKPKIDLQHGLEGLGAELVQKVKVAARARPRKRVPAKPSNEETMSHSHVAVTGSRSTDVVLAIGASTGGTEALRRILEALPADAPGVVIVQHMPENFTRHFAKRLDQLCAIHVREAANGDRIVAGQALIAPGGTQHMKVVRRGRDYEVRLVASAPVNHHRPSVDVLFASCAEEVGENAVGAILSGMGRDGAQGLLRMRRAGARTVAQNEATCVVFGMPKEAIACGAAETVAPIEAIGATLVRLAQSQAKRGSTTRGRGRPSSFSRG